MANARNLRLAWTFSTGLTRGHEAAPLIAGNTMYLVTPLAESALRPRSDQAGSAHEMGLPAAPLTSGTRRRLLRRGESILWIPAGIVYVAAGLPLFAAWLRESGAMVIRKQYAR